MNILSLINQDLDNYYHKTTKVLQFSEWHCAESATPSLVTKQGPDVQIGHQIYYTKFLFPAHQNTDTCIEY
jgi:hypothetical protein